MDKATTIKTIEKFMNSQEMTMLRLKKGVYGDNAKNLDQILVPYEQFISFIKDSSNNLQNLLGDIAYNSILRYLEEGFNLCSKIYHTFFTEPQGFFKKIKFIEASPLELEKAKSYYNDMLRNNEKIEEYLKIALQRLNSLDEKLFDQ